ncbi:dynein light chain LC6, flagellar outer arm isoform X1 [Cinnamomum micranthum f. kanehirae]|uniref:Dynein light chain LC6, flagellar outer arm isoform X1 n=1 Tax=Cinnamomum micranthum f. kanehirae TaxID=337451 RepID=A0A3S4NBQ4_9MAGN|nr:dynein light chain LC6, flagellar outer arm isoform X1 [Cinnamomum micranthum f. kanehirae]
MPVRRAAAAAAEMEYWYREREMEMVEMEMEMEMEMEGAEQELERRSRFLHTLIQNNKNNKKKNACDQMELVDRLNVCVRASDMPYALQDRAFRCARDSLDSMPKLDTKRLALALKKASNQRVFFFFFFFFFFCSAICYCSLLLLLLLLVAQFPRFSIYHDYRRCELFFWLQEFDTMCGPAWHCIVGTSFGSYVTHSLGGFLYFSIDKIYILLFKTAVEPSDH